MFFKVNTRVAAPNELRQPHERPTLIDQRKSKGQEFAVNTDGTAFALPPKRTLAEDVIEQVRNAIFRGYFAPGQRLSEEQLARSLKVSRGPIREALVRLEREGLISS